MTTTARGAIGTVAICGLVACGSSDEAAPEALTYHGDVRAVVEDHCLGCHTDGGIGPLRLDSFEALRDAAPAVVAAVEARSMPPWLPDPACRRYQGERVLTDAQVAVFRRWYEAGAVEGDPSAYSRSIRRQALTLEEMLGSPDLRLSAREPYVPSAERPDDYRCFVLDATFDRETFLVASDVRPDRLDLVHHVILYLVEERFAPAVTALDDADPGEGYTCFGGIGAGSQTPIAGWAPGDEIPPVSSDARIRIPAGARLVMQMHFNTLVADPSPDRTEVALWVTEERPNALLVPQFVANLGIDIDAGDPASAHASTLTNRGQTPWTIVQTSPHMHLLGRSFRTTKRAVDGSESCLIDIPRWDFDWQQGYAFRPGEEVIVQPGESIRLECSYDNSAANQPVFNGERLEPRDVTWGDGTLDEMCLNTLVFLEPYAPVPEPEAMCVGFQECYERCDARPGYPQTACMLSCGVGSGCTECVLGGLIPCTSDTCGRQSQALLDCFDRCALDGTCITEECGSSILLFDQCVWPQVRSGACDAELAVCNVSL